MRIRVTDFFVEMKWKINDKKKTYYFFSVDRGINRKNPENFCNNAVRALMQFSFPFWLILRLTEKFLDSFLKSQAIAQSYNDGYVIGNDVWRLYLCVCILVRKCSTYIDQWWYIIKVNAAEIRKKQLNYLLNFRTAGPISTKLGALNLFVKVTHFFLYIPGNRPFNSQEGDNDFFS